jgi:hypothetical protein
MTRKTVRPIDSERRVKIRSIQAHEYSKRGWWNLVHVPMLSVAQEYHCRGTAYVI